MMKKILTLIACFSVLFSLCSAAVGCTPEEASETASLSDEEILEARRETVVQAMREKIEFLWRVDEDITYSKAGPSSGPADSDSDRITLVKGRIYRGLPYTHGGGSLESFMTYASEPDEKGVYTISGLGSEDLSGNPGDTGFNRARISSDCNTTLFWSWGKVANSISFTWTREMTEATGCIKVGEYDAPTDIYTNTRTTCQENGLEVMCAAYAKLQKGDAAVYYVKGSGGHTVMIAEAHPVKKMGIIDPDESYVLIHDQPSVNMSGTSFYYDENLGENVYLCGRTDEKMTFRFLYGKGYLPITCKELIDPSPASEPAVRDSISEHTEETIFTGVFSSDYRISHVIIRIEDAKGTTVQQLTGYAMQSELKRFRLGRLNDVSEQDVLQGNIDIGALPPGKYRCTHTAVISTGEAFTVRDFEIVVK